MDEMKQFLEKMRQGSRNQPAAMATAVQTEELASEEKPPSRNPHAVSTLTTESGGPDQPEENRRCFHRRRRHRKYPRKSKSSRARTKEDRLSRSQNLPPVRLPRRRPDQSCDLGPRTPIWSVQIQNPHISRRLARPRPRYNDISSQDSAWRVRSLQDLVKTPLYRKVRDGDEAFNSEKDPNMLYECEVGKATREVLCGTKGKMRTELLRSCHSRAYSTLTKLSSELIVGQFLPRVARGGEPVLAGMHTK